ncbi:uncharacterized protein LOC128359488 [Scomber japonicus]|uniref:uncharacterized protein LOC128359488 n=1 Tax=Scomber japonicus TaxID=13676 RepID=UPI002306275D|nr:uncharacterized protein LOC128359488 [Scomber japonicus]
MFTWGEDSQGGFRVKKGSVSAAGDGVYFLKLGFHIKDLSAGHNVLAFVKSDGNVFIIRTNESNDGRRVRGNQKSVKYKEKIEAVSCGDDVVTLLSETGRVLYVDSAHPPFTPRPLEVLCNIPVSQVACGSQHSVALTKDGQVYTWGQDFRGQLGLGRRKLGGDSPQHLRSLSSIPLVQIAAGGEQSFALSVSGGVFSWGRNDCGQLGLGDTTDRHTPTPVHSLDMKKTIHISCGKDHTAILTKDGIVFTFGSSQYGQLGHNSFSVELRPRIVAELWGSKVIKIACGRHHTLVMTDSKRVYSFGCREQGQLGHGEESHPSVPLPVQLPQDTTDVPQIRNIYAGGNCSFATCSSTEDIHEGSNRDSMNKVQHCLDGLIDKWSSAHDSESWKTIEHRDKHFQTSPTYFGLNLSVANHNFNKLVKKDTVLAEVETAVMHLLPSLDKNPVGVEGLRIYLLLIELLHVIQKMKWQWSTNLAEAVAAAIVGLSADSLQVIGDWWSSLSASTMIKYIDVWKQTLSVILSLDPVPRNTGVKNLLLVLQYLYNKVAAEPLILCGFPIVMDLQTKKKVFDWNAAYTRMETMGRSWWDLFRKCGREVLPEELLFRLDLTKASVLEDAFEQLAAVDHSDYKKLLVMFSAESEMFIFNNSTTLAWFPSRATQDEKRYFMFGFLCGLALFNQCIIHLPFPLVLFKKLLGVKPSLEDMMEFSPCVGKTLQYILEDDDIENLDMYFLINWDETDVDLDPGNPEKLVTNQNKKEYVDAYVNYAFNTSVVRLFQEFERGFFQVCDRNLVKLFRPKELQEVLVGKDFHDWTKLKQNTGYEGDCHAGHPTIQMFWEVFDELTEDRKAAFLWFLTGFEKIPILGVDTIKMTVRVKEVEDLSYDQYYPETHTCFSILELPIYSTKEIMRDRLTEALTDKKEELKPFEVKKHNILHSSTCRYLILDFSGEGVFGTVAKCSHFSSMFTWGEDSQGGFRVEKGSVDAAGDGIHFLKLSFHIKDLSAGHSVLAFVKTNGNAFIIRTNERNDGRRVRGKQKFVKYKEKIEAVSCGDDVVTLLSETGRVLFVDSAHPPFTPRPLDVLCTTYQYHIPVSQVACGSQHSVALTKDGRVYTWGQDSRGQLGLGKIKLNTNAPQHLQSLSSIPLVQIAAGGDQSFALSVSGGVFSWGRNDCGQLGLGDTTDRHTPTPVHSLDMKKTIHISCGKDHTAILTKDGVVFTFGSSQYGQLGHNSFSEELRPRIVAELWGAKVIQIACGRHHTLVMTDSKRVYSFGCGEQDQLGHGEESHPSVPLPVQLPQDATHVPQIRDIYAGGSCSFATCSSTEDVHEGSNSDSMNKVQHCLDGLIDRWTSEHDSKSWKKIKQEIQRIFSFASCVNQSFLEQSRDKHFQTSPTYFGLNLSVARRNFKKLVKKENVLAEVETAVMHLLPSLDKKPVGVEGLRIYLLLIELLHVIQKHKRQQSTHLPEAVAAAVVRLSADSLQVIGDWWSSLSPSTMVKYVKVWKQTLSVILSLRPVPRNNSVKNLLLVLQYMYNANSRITEPRRMPERDFCLSMDEGFLNQDLQLWRLRSHRKNMRVEPLILCSFPIVMDLKSKKRVFDMNAEYTKDEAVEHVIFDLFWVLGWFPPLPQRLLFELDLKRATVLEDTFQQLAAVDHSNYKRALMVYFDANYFAVDDDNLQVKDFFHDVFHEMFSAESEMFMFNDLKTLAWFPSKATQDEKRYFLFGVLCGLALFNQCIIHLPFPLVLFKKLLGVKPSLEDMMEFSPCVGKTLQYILEDDDIENLDMYFLINWDDTEVDLDPDNPEKLVTNQNKKEFVDAYVNYAFNTSVVRLFQEFKRGFFQVCDRDLVKLFRPKELQEVLVGKDFHDWTKLKQNTHYEWGYHAGHPTIQMFWEVVEELTEDQKIALLWFVTGFEKVPILGVDTIKMTVRVKQVEDLAYDRYYPETHTCFSILELPIYSTKEIMRDRLTEALSNKRNSHK